MIAKENIEDLLRKNLITIGYTFEITDGKLVTYQNEQLVNPDDKESPGYRIFNTNFKGDRLSVTMGAIAYSHKYKKLKGRVNFNDQPYLFDLRETDGKISIQPGETVSVSSNERIRLNDDKTANDNYRDYFGAYILPRLTIADSGLFYVPSYIDPTWDGLMQAVLHNFSNKPVEIRICEPLAVCRFYKLDGEIDKGFKDNFAKLTHHFAQDWQSILDGSKQPVILGKRPIENPGFITNVLDIEKLKEKVKNNLLAIVSGTFLLSAATVAFTIKQVGWDYPKTKEDVAKLQKDITSVPKSRTITFNLDKGKKDFDFSEEIQVPNKYKVIFTQFNDEKFDVKKFQIIENLRTEDKVKLTFRLQLNSELAQSESLKIDLLFSE